MALVDAAFLVEVEPMPTSHGHDAAPRCGLELGQHPGTVEEGVLVLAVHEEEGLAGGDAEHRKERLAVDDAPNCGGVGVEVHGAEVGGDVGNRPTGCFRGRDGGEQQREGGAEEHAGENEEDKTGHGGREAVDPGDEGEPALVID